MGHEEEQSSGGVGSVGRQGEVGGESSSGPRERQERRASAEEAEWVEVPLTQGKVALIDKSDMLIVGRFRWCATKAGPSLWYAKRTQRWGGASHTVFLHRWIIEAPPGVLVDHVNGNTLDNRRCNLRLATHGQNTVNQRKRESARRFKGVRRYHQRFHARIKQSGVEVTIGIFRTEEDAARAYDRAATETFGAFARLNFPLDAAAKETT